MARPRIEYVIFDLDGLMIDSERVYTEVTNDILAKYGKEMTWDIKAGLMGKPDREAAQHLLSFFPDIPLTVDTYCHDRDVAQDLRWQYTQPLPGIRKLVRHLHRHGIPIAIATGTRRAKYGLKTAHLPDIFEECFGNRVVCTDDGKIGKGRGKPCPDIFLVAAEMLGMDVGGVSEETEECGEVEREVRARGLVFEDAIPGIQAGKRAGMAVVWVPDANLVELKYSEVHRADHILKSVEDFVPEQWGLPPFDS